MTRQELRTAMRRAVLDQVLKMLDLAWNDYSEGEPTDEERAAYFTIQRAYERARDALEISGE